MLQKKILSIGAGYAQEDFVEALKKRGFYVISIGKGTNSPKVIENSDLFAEVDTHSYSEIVKWISDNNIKFDVIGSFAGGGAILTLQKLNAKFNMPTKIPDELMVGMDKFSQQTMYEKYQLTSIRSWNSSNIINNIPNDIQKFVVKPAVGRGSVGVEFMDRMELITRIKNNVILDNNIIQEFRTGIEYRMVMMVQRGSVKLMAPIMRESLEGSSLLGRLYYSMSNEDRIHAFCTNLVKKLGLNNTILKFDILVSKDHIDLIEMDISVGGGIYFQTFVGELFNIDIINTYIDLISDIDVPVATIKNGGMVMDYVFNKTGKKIMITQEVAQKVATKVVGGDCKIILNKLRPWETGKFGSNADFVMVIIHSNSGINNSEINDRANHIFESLC